MQDRQSWQGRFRSGRKHFTRSAAIFLTLFSLLSSGPICAQSADDQDLKETVRQLAQQVQQLQKKVTELEAKKGSTETAVPAAVSNNAAPTTPATPPAEPDVATPASDPPPTSMSGHTMEIPGGPQMRIQGFTHTGFAGTTKKDATNGFFLGNFDLFITSRLSEKFSMLTELNFEAGEDNNFGIDLERMLLVYKANEYFQLNFGRYHTDIGYYNNAYHHGNWFETATVRPSMFLFEDQGGILPVHNVGLSVQGKIPSGSFGLHYSAELGNGRPARHPENTTVQNSIDENNGKSFNFAVFARPEWAHGMQAGFSIYHDHLIPTQVLGFRRRFPPPMWSTSLPNSNF